MEMDEIIEIEISECCESSFGEDKYSSLLFPSLFQIPVSSAPFFLFDRSLLGLYDTCCARFRAAAATRYHRSTIRNIRVWDVEVLHVSK